MYRIRFHGRGGQGMKTASRILGSALFIEGFQVQDAPRYGAERRGAPLFAYVRADTKPIYERGVIQRPDLAVVADDSLVPLPAAGVLTGVDSRTVLLINSEAGAAEWRRRLGLSGRIVTLPVSREDTAELRFIGATCASAAARLIGAVRWPGLAEAIRLELDALGGAVVTENLARGRAAWDRVADEEGCVQPRPPLRSRDCRRPEWVQLPFEAARASAPDVFAAANSVQVATGLWRTLRPVVDYGHCKGCWWVCGSFCPDGAIRVEKGLPQVDYQHCKGCLVCLAQCPSHAIEAVVEQGAAEVAS